MNVLEHVLPPLVFEDAAEQQRASHWFFDLSSLGVIVVLHAAVLLAMNYWQSEPKPQEVLELGVVHVRMINPVALVQPVPKPATVPPAPQEKVVLQTPPKPTAQPAIATALPPPPPETQTQAEPAPNAPVMAAAAPDLPAAPREISINEASYLVAPTLRYPSYARDRGIQGEVIIRVLVGEDGAVEKVSVAKSVHKLLDDAARQTMRKAKFRPYKINGKAVKVYVKIPFDFTL